MPDGGLRRVVILTAIPVEYQAVHAHLTKLRQEMHPSGTVYERGDFITNDQSWDVLIAETGAGNTKATAETVRAIEYFKPSLVLFVGVAGGLKDVKLGDVVAATKVYGYESGKADPIFRPRPDVRSSTHRMEHRARAEAKKQDWIKRLMKSFPDPNSAPSVYVAPIASGNQIAASTDSAVLDLLRSSYGDAVAVEMEGYGFLEAVRAYPRIDALIIRGISDLIDDKFESDAKKYQEVAARHASAFAFEILTKLDVGEPQQNESTTVIPDKVSESAEVNQALVDLHDKSETSSLPSAERNYLQEFLLSIKDYGTKMREFCELFGEGRLAYRDDCTRALKLMDSLKIFIKDNYKNLTQSSRNIKLRLDNLLHQIKALQSDLRDFPYAYSSSKRSYHYSSKQKKIREKFNSLLESLEQLVNES